MGTPSRGPKGKAHGPTRESKRSPVTMEVRLSGNNVAVVTNGYHAATDGPCERLRSLAGVAGAGDRCWWARAVFTVQPMLWPTVSWRWRRSHSDAWLLLTLHPWSVWREWGWPPPLVCWRPSAAEEPTEREQIQGPGDVYVLFGPWLRDLSQEDFHVLMLDTRHRVVREAMVTRGTLYVSLISPREMFRLAGLENDAVVIPVHNYLSGDPSPSPDDRAVTSRIVEAERTLGIPVLDHVIVGDGRYTSLAE